MNLQEFYQKIKGENMFSIEYNEQRKQYEDLHNQGELITKFETSEDLLEKLQIYLWMVDKSVGIHDRTINPTYTVIRDNSNDEFLKNNVDFFKLWRELGCNVITEDAQKIYDKLNVSNVRNEKLDQLNIK